MENDPAVKKYRVTDEIHAKYILRFSNGKPEYEFLTEE